VGGCTCVRACLPCIHALTYVHTHTHTYTHTHTHTQQHTLKGIKEEVELFQGNRNTHIHTRTYTHAHIRTVSSAVLNERVFDVAERRSHKQMKFVEENHETSADEVIVESGGAVSGVCVCVCVHVYMGILSLSLSLSLGHINVCVCVRVCVRVHRQQPRRHHDSTTPRVPTTHRGDAKRTQRSHTSARRTRKHHQRIDGRSQKNTCTPRCHVCTRRERSCDTPERVGARAGLG